MQSSPGPRENGMTGHGCVQVTRVTLSPVDSRSLTNDATGVTPSTSQGSSSSPAAATDSLEAKKCRRAVLFSGRAEFRSHLHLLLALGPYANSFSVPHFLTSEK